MRTRSPLNCFFLILIAIWAPSAWPAPTEVGGIEWIPGHKKQILNQESREWDERDARQSPSGSGGEGGMPNHESRNPGDKMLIRNARNEEKTGV